MEGEAHHALPYAGEAVTATGVEHAAAGVYVEDANHFDGDLPNPDDLATMVQDALAEQMNSSNFALVQADEVPDVSAGQMRLTGSFQGVATTHTHQLDLAVGLDVEMPSEMAAEAMKQLAQRSRSPSRGRSALRDKPDGPPEPRSIWNSLHNFFRRDAYQSKPARRHSRSRSASVQLRLKDHSEETKQLASTLEEVEGQAAQYEAQLLALEGEKVMLVSQIELLQQEVAEQALYIDEMKRHHEEHFAGAGAASDELAERDEQIRRLHLSVAESGRAIAAHEASLAMEREKSQRLHEAVQGSLTGADELKEKNASLESHIQVLSMQIAGLNGQVSELRAENHSLSGSQQHEEASRQRDEAIAECAKLTAALQEAEHEEAEARRELALQVQEMTQRALSAESLKDACAREVEELSIVVQQLRSDNSQLQGKLAAAESGERERGHFGTAHGAVGRPSERALDLGGHDHGKIVEDLQMQVQTFRKERDRAEQEKHAGLTERDAATQRLAQHRAEGDKLRAELADFKSAHANALAAAREAEACAANSGRSLDKAQADCKDWQAKVEDLQSKLYKAHQDTEKLAAEKRELRSKVAYHEGASGQAQAQLIQCTKKEVATRFEAGEAKRDNTHLANLLESQLKVLETRLADGEKAAAAERQAAAVVCQERDELARELREQRQVESATMVQLKAELREAKARELHIQAANAQLEAELKMMQEEQGDLFPPLQVDGSAVYGPNSCKTSPRYPASSVLSPPSTSASGLFCPPSSSHVPVTARRLHPVSPAHVASCPAHMAASPPRVVTPGAVPVRGVPVNRSAPVLSPSPHVNGSAPVRAVASAGTHPHHLLQNSKGQVVSGGLVTSVRISPPVRTSPHQGPAPMQGKVSVQVTGIRRIVR